ncbi:hypothetical protein NSQ41_01675 [Aeribacillus sp. FSL K6-8210]|uniref:hypothetical protein n=1 Tax=Aeribacillus sp. FSL K6-8210 TaxID=2954683 RepID=UPI0030D4EE26
MKNVLVLMEKNFDRIYKNFNDLCSMFEENHHLDYQSFETYQQLRRKLIEDVKALEYFIVGTMKSKEK